MMTATDKLMDLLDQPQEVVDKPDAVELYQATGHIEFENGQYRALACDDVMTPMAVTFSYDKLPPILQNAANTNTDETATRDALKNVSFSISPGQPLLWWEPVAVASQRSSSCSSVSLTSRRAQSRVSSADRPACLEY